MRNKLNEIFHFGMRVLFSFIFAFYLFEQNEVKSFQVAIFKCFVRSKVEKEKPFGLNIATNI